MNSDYVRERSIGKTSDSIDLYTKIELMELSSVLILVYVATWLTYYQDTLFNNICESDSISYFLISHFGYVGIALIYTILFIGIFIIINKYEKVLDVKFLGTLVFLIFIFAHAFDVYHDYIIYLAGGY